jgi:hypothetical protein
MEATETHRRGIMVRALENPRRDFGGLLVHLPYFAGKESEVERRGPPVSN